MITSLRKFNYSIATNQNLTEVIYDFVFTSQQAKEGSSVRFLRTLEPFVYSDTFNYKGNYPRYFKLSCCYLFTMYWALSPFKTLRALPATILAIASRASNEAFPMCGVKMTFFNFLKPSATFGSAS